MSDTVGEGYAIVMRSSPFFLFFHVVGGYVLIPMLALTILLSKKVYRHPTLVNFVIVWIPYSIGYTMLFYLNQQGNPSPSRGLCIAQGIIVQGTPPMCSVAGFALVTQIFLGITERMQKWSQRGQRIFTILAVTAPYLTFILFIIGYGALQANVPFLLGPRDTIMYCSTEGRASKNPALNPSLKGLVSFSTLLDPLFSAIVLVLSIGFLVRILIGIYRNFYVNRREQTKNEQLIISCAFRVSAFLVYSLLIIATAVVSLAGAHTAAPFIIQASLPLVVFLLFGTQLDVLHTWVDAIRFIFRIPKPAKLDATRRDFLRTPYFKKDGMLTETSPKEEV